MGKIVSTDNLKNNKCQVSWEGKCEEYEKLFGRRNNVYLFSTENPMRETCTISRRGEKSATKYFLIPPIWRDRDIAKCERELHRQRMETEQFIFYLFTLKKKPTTLK